MTKKKFSFPCPHCGGELSAEVLAPYMRQLMGSVRGSIVTEKRREYLTKSIAKARESYAAKRESETPEEREARREQCRQAAKIRWAAKRAAKEGVAEAIKRAAH